MLDRLADARRGLSTSGLSQSGASRTAGWAGSAWANPFWAHDSAVEWTIVPALHNIYANRENFENRSDRNSH